VLQDTIALLAEVKQILNHVQAKRIEIQQVHYHFLIVPCVLLENFVQVMEHFHQHLVLQDLIVLQVAALKHLVLLAHLIQQLVREQFVNVFPVFQVFIATIKVKSMLQDLVKPDIIVLLDQIHLHQHLLGHLTLLFLFLLVEDVLKVVTVQKEAVLHRHVHQELTVALLVRQIYHHAYHVHLDIIVKEVQSLNLQVHVLLVVIVQVDRLLLDNI